MTPEMETGRLQEFLKRQMKQKKKTYHELAVHLGVSLATAKRLLNSDDVSLRKVTALCHWLDLTLSQAATLADESRTAKPQKMTHDQEAMLINNPHFAAFYRLLVYGKSPQWIARRFNISTRSMEEYLLELKTQKLLEDSETSVANTVPIHKLKLFRSGSALSSVWLEKGLRRRCAYFLEKAKESVSSIDNDENLGRKEGLLSSMEFALKRSTYQKMVEDYRSVALRYLEIADLERRYEDAEARRSCVVVLMASQSDNLPVVEEGEVRELIS